MNNSSRSVDLMRMADGRLEIARDRVAVEAALEVRLNGHPFAVIMRTPGNDADLAAGFLFSEGVIRSSDDVQRIDLPGDRGRTERGAQPQPRGDSPGPPGYAPERRAALLLRVVRPPHARVPRSRRIAARCRLASSTPMSSQVSRLHCETRSMRLTKPAAFTQRASSISRAASS